MSLTTALTILAQVTIVLLTCGAVVALMRRASAALHHLILMIGLGGALLVPLLDAVLPEWGIATVALGEASAIAASVGVATAGAFAGRIEFESLLPTVWLAGSVLMLLWVVSGEVRVARRLRAQRDPVGATWQRAISAAGTDLHRVRFVECDWLSAPCTWGVVRPAVLLPHESEHWSDSDRRFAIVHELAHIHRGDLVANLIARLATAVFWWHPLAWVIARSARLARERACDDAVIRGEESIVGYATLLHSLGASAMADENALAPTLGLAHRSALGSRIRSVLDGSRSRAVVSARARGFAVVLGLALVTFAATIAPAQQPSASSDSLPGRLRAIHQAAKRACDGWKGAPGDAKYSVRLRAPSGKQEEFTISVRCGIKGATAKV